MAVGDVCRKDKVKTAPYSIYALCTGVRTDPSPYTLYAVHLKETLGTNPTGAASTFLKTADLNFLTEHLY